MAKKSSSNRQRPASHAKGGATNKTQTSTATLVHATKPNSAGLDSTKRASEVETQSKPAAASIVRDTPAAPAKPAAKPATPPKAAAAPTKTAALATKTEAPTAKPAPAASKRQDTRVARARATQRARQAGYISAENFSYVLGDLKLVAWLAGGAFAILIALTFFLPR